jgi:hypothetical protein
MRNLAAGRRIMASSEPVCAFVVGHTTKETRGIVAGKQHRVRPSPGNHPVQDYLDLLFAGVTPNRAEYEMGELYIEDREIELVVMVKPRLLQLDNLPIHKLIQAFFEHVMAGLNSTVMAAVNQRYDPSTSPETPTANVQDRAVHRETVL